MNRRHFQAAFILTLVGGICACTSEQTPSNINVKVNSNTAANTAPVNNAPANASNANISSTTPANNAPNTVETAPGDAAAPIAAVVSAYYNALQSKNEAALKNTQSAGAIKETEAAMRAMQEKSILTYTLDLDAPPSKPFQVRRVDMQGNSAVAEIFNPDTQTAFPVKFVKENNEWKYAAPSEQKQLIFSGQK